MSSPGYALFDFDGVLVDSWEVARESLAEACRKAGLEPPLMEIFRKLMGLPLELILERLDLPLRIAVDFRNIARSKMDQIPVYAGIKESLIYAAAHGIKVGILTGKDRARSELLLERKGLAPFVAALITPDDAPPKPDPMAVGSVLRALNAERSRAVYIGDTGIDMQAARAAGVKAVFAAWGAQAELRPSEYDHRLGSTRELMAFLRTSLGAET